MTLRRSVQWAGVLLILFLLGPGYSSVSAQSDCQVTFARGWATGTGQARMVMRNTGQPCAGELWSDPDARIYADMLEVVTQPSNGAVTVSAPRFSYTPNPGYVGRDRFELRGAGGGRGGRRITLGGEVVVLVNP